MSGSIIRMIPLPEATGPDVGGKAAALGELLRAKLPVSGGFVVPVQVFLEHVERAFGSLRPSAGTEEKSRAIMETPLSDDLVSQFHEAWGLHIHGPAAVRSSANVEDSPNATFAGQFRTVLNVENVSMALEGVRSCWASLLSQHVEKYASSLRYAS